WAQQMSSNARWGVVNAPWMVAALPAALLFAFFACDLWVWAFERSGPLAARSLTRGFEPFEKMWADLAARRGAGKGGDSLVGDLAVAAMMGLGIPGLAWVVMNYGLDMRLVVSIPLSLAAGIATFLVLGLVGD